MAISRNELLKELLPGLNELFGIEYRKYGDGYRYERNRQLHGLAEVDQNIIELSHKKPPEGYTQGSSI
jgi:hypothetical protein